MDIISSYGANGMDITGYAPDTSVLSAPVAASASGSWLDNFSLSGLESGLGRLGDTFQSLGDSAGRLLQNPGIASLVSTIAGGSKKSKTSVATPGSASMVVPPETPWLKYAAFAGVGLLGVFLVYKIVRS